MARIQRDNARVVEIAERHADRSSLKAIHAKASPAAALVAAAAKQLRDARLTQNKEATERDVASRAVLDWIQEWRPIALLEVDGAAANLKALPPGAPTPDQLAAVAESLADLFGGLKGDDGNQPSFAVDAIAALRSRCAIRVITMSNLGDHDARCAQSRAAVQAFRGVLGPMPGGLQWGRASRPRERSPEDAGTRVCRRSRHSSR